MDTSVRLNTKKYIPLVGFGTWKLQGDEAYEAVKTAIDTGYRLIDTAKVYGNEEAVGRAIKDSGVPREELFVTTKLWEDDFLDVEEALATSLKKLGIDYVDLYLIHWPKSNRVAAYKAMETEQEKGRTRAIGVSNFTIQHLEELLANTTVIPAINQVEFNPFLNQQELLSYCNENGIVLEAYSPLSHAHKLDDERLTKLAAQYGKSPAQLMLRWAIQQGVVAIPKSGSTSRMQENFNIFDFEISDEDMEDIRTWNEMLRFSTDPHVIQ